ncbi:GntR family transcriptional regulator [Microbacterium sp. SSW1-59]|uniref:GntR family transcriptional regulator n=1 Tax=Microbacterium xanthum TaxID=3079794 RepID=UPI002AD49974|nr:GntR family transcriptional regulator [Microbacterium sp. SSW1-59]MDZ8200916.1 GntR family transcriptional regulator [Microbacterium sp. SSW1-59]
MSLEPLGVDDVYRIILDRIGAGDYARGSRLPSCRRLAGELGSNPSTVDRAVRRLAEMGLVRTVPRTGTYVATVGTPVVDSRGEIGDEIRRVLRRAWRSGVPLDEIRALIDDAVDELEVAPRIAFVECNRRDLQHMHSLVRRESGFEMQPVLLADAWGRTLDDEFDIVTTPVFHLNDLSDVVSDFDNVVEITFVASQSALRQLVNLRHARRLVVAAPTARGVSWMAAVVGQYFSGPIEHFHIGVDDSSRLEGVDVVVVNNAARLPDGWEGRIPNVVPIEWELDPRFATSFKERIGARLARRRKAVS